MSRRAVPYTADITVSSPRRLRRDHYCRLPTQSHATAGGPLTPCTEPRGTRSPAGSFQPRLPVAGSGRYPGVVNLFAGQRRCLAMALTLCGLAGVMASCRKAAPDPVAGSPPFAVMKVAQLLPENHPTTESMGFFRRRVSELSGGRLEVRLFPGGQMGTAVELVELCRLGNLEGGVVSTAVLSDYVPELIVTTLPFIFRDSAHQYAAIDGEPGRLWRQAMAERGLVGAAFFDAGTRNLMTRRPVIRPEDLHGLKIRAMPSATLQAAIERLGAAAQPLSMGEVYSALQTQVIDGWENNPATCLAYSMYETGCIHFTWTRHVAIPDVLMVSRRWLRALPADLQAVLRQAAAETQQHQRRLWQQREQEAIAQLKAHGMQFHEPDTPAFAARVEGFYEPYVRRYGERVARIIEAIRRLDTRSPTL